MPPSMGPSAKQLLLNRAVCFRARPPLLELEQAVVILKTSKRPTPEEKDALAVWENASKEERIAKAPMHPACPLSLPAGRLARYSLRSG